MSKFRFSLAVSSCALMVATGAQAETDWGSTLGSHDGTEVNLMVIADPFIEPLRDITAQFEAVTSAEVTVDGFGYDPLHEKQILGCSQGDSQYDVLFIDGIWIGEFVEAGCLDPVEDLLDGTDPAIIAWDDYVASFSGQAVWDGQRQCLPVGAYWHMLHYRTDIFEALGIAPPETFDDVLAAAKAVTESSEYPDVSGYAMNFKRGAAAGQQFFEWIYSAGGRPWESNYPGSPDAYADQTPTLTSPESIAMLQFFEDMVAYGPTGVEGFAWDERFNSFAQGNVAMINAWSVRTPGLNNPDISKVAGNWDVTMFPHAEGAESVPPVGGWIMCLNAHSERKDAAWDFMRWFASPEVHKDWVMMGAPASRHSTFQDPEVIAAQPWLPTLYESAQAAWTELRPRHAMTFEMIDAVGLHVNRAIIDEVSPDQAMADATAEVTKMLTDGGLLD